MCYRLGAFSKIFPNLMSRFVSVWRPMTASVCFFFVYSDGLRDLYRFDRTLRKTPAL